MPAVRSFAGMRLGTMTSPNRAEVHERHTHGSRNLYEFFGSGWHVTVSVVGVPLAIASPSGRCLRWDPMSLLVRPTPLL